MGKLLENFNQKKKQFEKIKDAYCKKGLSFDLYFSGSIVKVVFEDGKTKKHGSIPSKPGMFLPRMTADVVKKRLDSGEYVPKNTESNRFLSSTIMYSSAGIKKSINQLCVSVDITACYWQTAYNIGVIDEPTYLKGMSKDREYKDARNISIGAIGALVFHQKYVNGELVSSDRSRKFGSCARLDIVDHVWDMAQRVASKLGKDFLMYLTDCFFVPATRVDDLCKYIEEEGYKWKIGHCEFGPIERMNSGIGKILEGYYTEKVIWYDIDKDKFKFHDFNSTHDKNF